MLDGLDEIPENLRGHAIASVNDALRPGEGIILSSRAEQYERAVDPLYGRPVRLQGAAGIELYDLNAADVESYLRRDAVTARSAARWDPIFTALHAGGPVTQAFSTPLMVGLARVIYNPRPGEQTASMPDPGELCDTSRFPLAAEIERHLFDVFIRAAYRPHPDPGRRCSWSAEQAERWLVFLARHLEGNLGGTTDFAWWQLRNAIPRPLVALTAGSICGVSIGIAAWLGPHYGHQLGIGIGIGLIVGLVFGVSVRARVGYIGSLIGGLAGSAVSGMIGGFLGGLLSGQTPTVGLIGGVGLGIGVGPVAGLAGGIAGGLMGGLFLGMTAGHASGLAAGLVDGLGAALAAGVCAEFAGRKKPALGLRGLRWTPAGLAVGNAAGLGVGITIAITAGLASGLGAGLVVGLAATVAFGLQNASPGPEAITGPGTSLANDRRTFLTVGCAAGITFGLAGSLGIWIGVGLGAAIAVGLGVGFLQSAYGYFLVASCWLALRRKLPWRLMRFLADAHEQRGVLRQSGALYQFRHAGLQKRLSNRPDSRNPLTSRQTEARTDPHLV